MIGTRPEGIKLAPVVKALERLSDQVEVRTALTGQHSELLDQVLEFFDLEPEWDLEIMREGQDLYDVANGTLSGLRSILREYRPDLVVVQGDTASVFFGALAAFFERTRVAHVEAGLRSREKWKPFPEEILRRLTGVVADFHFAPTDGARANLLSEGVAPESIYVTGNTVVDALHTIAHDSRPVRNAQLRAALTGGARLVLLTAHRRESFGAPLREAFSAARELADHYTDVAFVYPVHPNPHVLAAAKELLGGHERILLTEPLDYPDLVTALRKATLVLTDSGGIQEEAPSFGTPVLVLREVTERPEGVEAGVARLVGTSRRRILEEAHRLLGDESARQRMATAANPYGDGRAGERIADVIAHVLAGSPRTLTDWEGGS